MEFIRYQRRIGLFPPNVDVMGSDPSQFITEFEVDPNFITWASRQFYSTQNDLSALEFRL